MPCTNATTSFFTCTHALHCFNVLFIVLNSPAFTEILNRLSEMQSNASWVSVFNLQLNLAAFFPDSDLSETGSSLDSFKTPSDADNSAESSEFV